MPNKELSSLGFENRRSSVLSVACAMYSLDGAQKKDKEAFLPKMGRNLSPGYNQIRDKYINLYKMTSCILINGFVNKLVFLLAYE